MGRVGPFRHDAGEHIALFTPVDLGLRAGDDLERAVQPRNALSSVSNSSSSISGRTVATCIFTRW